MTLDTLNQQFALDPQVQFVQDKGGMPMAVLDNGEARAEVSLHGGQVLSYQPRGQEPVLWLSNESHFRHDQAIRGGIPVCWPWFGSHPDNPNLPSHGFARTMLWQKVSTDEPNDGSI